MLKIVRVFISMTSQFEDFDLDNVLIDEKSIFLFITFHTKL